MNQRDPRLTGSMIILIVKVVVVYFNFDEKILKDSVFKNYSWLPRNIVIKICKGVLDAIFKNNNSDAIFRKL